MSYYLVSVPERTPAGAAKSEDSALDIAVDTENNRVEFRSGNGKNVINLDLICAAEVSDTLCQLVSSKDFQATLAEKISEHLRGHNAQDCPAP